MTPQTRQLISAKIYRDKTTRLTKQAGFFFILHWH
jgi:hypothetical protein